MGHADPNDKLAQLQLMEPESARILDAAIAGSPHCIDNKLANWIAKEILWALGFTPGFGREVAGGYARLAAAKTKSSLPPYRSAIRKAGARDLTLATIMARHLPAVLLENDTVLLEKFNHAIQIITRQGVHTLNTIMEGVAHLLSEDDTASALAFLDLLPTAFGAPLSYHQYLDLSVLLPKAAINFTPARRPWQISALKRVIQTDIRLTDPFLTGMESGLRFLGKSALDRFIQTGLSYHRQHPGSGPDFFSLSAGRSAALCESLQVSIPFSAVHASLNRYLRARTGIPIHVRPFSDPKAEKQTCIPGNMGVFSDGRAIYLPDEINCYNTREENRQAYHLLAKIESGFYEFETFEFDLASYKANLHHKNDSSSRQLMVVTGEKNNTSDFHRFFQMFSCPLLAEDLLNIVEQGRIRLCFESRYPGLARAAYPFLQKEILRLKHTPNGGHPLFSLYATIALGIPPADIVTDNSPVPDSPEYMTKDFSCSFNCKSSIEQSALVVHRWYAKTANRLAESNHAPGEGKYIRLTTPYGIRLRPDLFFNAHRHSERLARRIRAVFKEYDIALKQSRVRRAVITAGGNMSKTDVEQLLAESKSHGDAETERRATAALASPALQALLSPSRILPDSAKTDNETVFRYPEWDATLGDYLKNHVRVLEKTINTASYQTYENILMRHRGMIGRIHYGFRLLKPEGLVILRRWREGEAFDYRALLDFAIDKKAGITPSERLYTRRIKQQRDVAVLLLVDLSRSTASPINRGGIRVVDVEREALVLFCEALEIVGDRYAVAGFSGTGPLGVDYYRIKNFSESLDKTVKGRICAIAPKRSTRMGAAIRHATHCLETIPSKTRLLIILGDGFPNDLGYKSSHAIEDTRSAINEARSKQILTRAISVNMAQNPRLDSLYGSFHHAVISDVRELPDKLLQMYARLTRH